jgi:hypothetical protein
MLLHTAVVDGLKYNESHEWAKVDGGTATVGLSDFAQVLINMHAVASPVVELQMGDASTSRCVLPFRRSWGISFTWSCRRLAPRSSKRSSLAWSNPSRWAFDLHWRCCTPGMHWPRLQGQQHVHTATNPLVHNLESRACVCTDACSKSENVVAAAFGRLPAMYTHPSVVRSQRSTQRSQTTHPRLVSVSS